MMRLKDWRATKRVVPNLAEEMKEYDDAPMKPGVMYHGNVWIQGPLANGEYWLLIERSEYTGPLDSLELRLYEWCDNEGLLEEPKIVNKQMEVEVNQWGRVSRFTFPTMLAEDADMVAVLEWLFRQMNGVDGKEMISVFDIPGPSLSVGGIVTLNGRKFLCQPMGWEEVKS